MAYLKPTKYAYMKWFRRYWIFFFIAGVILTIQGLLAYSFYSIDSGNENGYAFRGNTGRSKGNVQLTHKLSQQRNQEPLFLEDYLTDDEDSPSNLWDRGGKDSSSRNAKEGWEKQKSLAKVIVPERRVPVKGVKVNDVLPNPSSSLNENTVNKSLEVLKLNLDELDFKPWCNVSAKEAISAIHRATTQKCKEEIANVTCLIQNSKLYPFRLPRSCPTDDVNESKYLGCYGDDPKKRLLSSYTVRLSENNPSRCKDICLRSGFQFAGVQYSLECFCGKVRPPLTLMLAEKKCDRACPKDPTLKCGGFLAMNVYQTGLPKFVKQELLMPPKWSYPRHVCIVFLLTVNGRALRQVKRLIKALYHKQHYFYIHVDSRQDYLYRELLPLEKALPNVRLSRHRLSTIWGGASLLQMLLRCIEDLLIIPGWKWDYVINLSESDFPIKSLERLEMFLTANMKMNFVKSHGQDTNRFIAKQGLDKSFYECDNHMWRLGDRPLPWGIRMDGGSDWVALNREFCSYLINQGSNQLLTGLKTVFKYTLLPAESFFHTVLQNSIFCNRIVDNNLHITNWKRKQGCKCQYKHIVDWCGCSPNVFKTEDWPRIQSTEDRPFFFGRKFEPSISQSIIEQIERWISIPRSVSLPSVACYWQNLYHYLDSSPKPDDAFVTVFNSFSRLGIRQLGQAHLEIIPCTPKFQRLLESSLYFEDDDFKGNLVLYEAQLPNLSSPVLIETQLRPIQRYYVHKATGLLGSLKSLQVGSDFDQKELVFRNFGRILGPFTEPGVLHRWGGVSQSFAVTFIWVDPVGTVAGSYEVKVETGSQDLYHKPTFHQPLRPGVWSLLLMDDWVLVAETQFLVTPLSFYGAQEVGQEQVKFLHKGPGQPYVDHDFSQVEALLKSLNTNLDQTNLSSFSRSTRRQASANAHRYGPDLRDWIDNLVGQFWSVQATCFVAQPVHPTGGAFCPQLDLEPCQNTPWSSMVKDPKSEIGNVDPETGRLF